MMTRTKKEVVGMRLYRFPDLRTAGVSFTRKHLRTLEMRGEFPQHFYIGTNSTAWVAAEVDEWVEQKIRSRRVTSKPVATESAPTLA